MSEITRSRANIRNERVELVVHYALNSMDSSRYHVDRRFRVGSSGFCTEFDHLVKDNLENFVLLGQTTCYKERGVGGGEPNKTYEMRETLMEYLLVHVNLLFEESTLNMDSTRFFHIIVGDPAYSYSYFHKIRSRCYDLNIVIHPPGGIDELYKSLEAVLPRKLVRNQATALGVLNNVVCDNKPPIVNHVVSTIKEAFTKYINKGYPQSSFGLVQAKAICDLAKERNVEAVKTSQRLSTGKGIKELYLKAAKGRTDAYGADIKRVVDHIFQKRLFLPEAKKALKNSWEQYIDSLLRHAQIEAEQQLSDAVHKLWNIRDSGKRELTRRILIKLPGAVTEKGTAYPQDIPLKGVSEHNLYKNVFDTSTTRSIVKYITEKLRRVDITSLEILIQQMKSYGRAIIKSGFHYDVANGTVIRPVRHYVVKSLEEEGYRVLRQKDALRTTIKGYHGELFDVVTRPFASIEVICTKQGLPIALFKAKYFRPPEFDRRIKEEGFVSFTSAFQARRQRNKITLKRKLKELPLVMFIDTDADWTPQPEPIKYLVRMGWTVFFRIPDLVGFLNKLVSKAN